MGEDVESTEFTGQDRQRYREKVRRCLDVFARMLTESKFDFERPLTGLEIEFNLIDERHDPAMKNTDVLTAIANEDFQTELGRFNIEINVRPRELTGDSTDELETDLRASLNDAEERARTQGAHIVMIGILPTLVSEDLTRTALSDNTRYALLDAQIFAARGEDLHIAIDGPERLSTYSDTIAPEAACTSVQFHLQVSPQDYANNWNAAQSIAGVQLALGANSPFLFGKELWRETRIALFEQATDTRPEELKTQGVRPRVWFGERWINSIFDQFEENVSYFPAMLPVCDPEDPVAVLARGDTPRLQELRMHNGTIYRWNRPVYDVFRNKPHLRVENRVLPAGPTVIDILANGAFYYGAAAGARRGGPADLDPAVLRRRRGQLLRRRPARHRCHHLLAGPRRGAGHRTGAAPAAADGSRGPGTVGGQLDGARPVARRSSSSAASCTPMARSGRRTPCTGSSGRIGGWIAGTRCGRCSAGTWSTCTPTSRCTPGLPSAYIVPT